MRLRKPTFITNLQSYFQHFGRGILLLIGVLAIIALVVATFIYGDQRREQVQEETTNGEVATTQEADDNDVNTGTSEDAVTPTPQDSAGDGEQAAGTEAATDQPAEIANTGPEHIYALAAMLMGWLLYAHRRSIRWVRQAQSHQ